LCGESGRARTQAVERAVQGAAHHRGAVLGVAGEIGEPGAQGGHHRLGEQPAVQRGLGDDEQRCVGEGVVGEHLTQVGGDLVLGGGRHPVEQHG
jgi:hypothetical protein